MYLLLGRELEQIEYATAGTVVGITGLQDYVIKSATLSSTYTMPAFTELTLNVTPILRVAVEPRDPRDLPKLRRGLKILNQADPCVQVSMGKSNVDISFKDETGIFVLLFYLMIVFLTFLFSLFLNVYLAVILRMIDLFFFFFYISKEITCFSGKITRQW